MRTEWPELSYSDAKGTYETLHLWTQIAGKIKLAKLPWINHSWHVTLSVTPTGLTTSNIMDGNRHFSIDFDFIKHRLIIVTNDAHTQVFDLRDISVANFYKKIFKALQDLGIDVKINPIPNEMENVIPLDKDTTHGTYNTTHASNFHKALLNAHNVFTQFRSEFIGKCSPVHFFWGGFDLAVTRFSGREAPLHPGGVPHLPDWVAREAYSHEVSSCGFWPGNNDLPFAAFYSYFYPEPDNFSTASIKPEQGYYHPQLREFILPYDVVQQSKNPTETLLDFLHSTYEAGTDLAGWSRKRYEMKTPEEHGRQNFRLV